MSEHTVKCPICGKPYKVFMFYAGDQSACPDCRDGSGGKWKLNNQTPIDNG